MNSRKILITGAAGMVGSYARQVFSDDELILTDIVDGFIPLDVQDPPSVMQKIASLRPDAVLHLAAATDVDRCEEEPEWAYRSNAIGTQNIALACLKYHVPLIYVSTAGVFFGDKPEPYTEFDLPRPANVYGQSKLAGEEIVASLLSRYFIVRAGWMVGGGPKDKKFVGKIARLMAEDKDPLRIVNDKWGSPTFAKDLLLGIRQLLKTDYYGLYHMANKGCCTRYAVALWMKELLHRRTTVLPVSSAYFPLPAPRARSEALRNFKLELLGMDLMRPWEEALREYIQQELEPNLAVLQGSP